MKFLRRIAPVLLIALAPPVMLYTIWFNPVSAAEDDVTYVFPLRTMVGQALRQGRWPVDNPLEAMGSPLMADPQSSTMFPPTWLFAALDAKLAYSLSVFLAFSLAGGGAYLYLRKVGLIRPAATFGAVAFMFCGFMAAHRVHLPMIQTAAMFPWGLWCAELLRRRPVAAIFPLAAVLFAAITAGHWAILTYMSLAWAVYLLVRGRPLIRSAVAVAAAGLAAGAMAAPQIEATFALFAHSTRGHIGYATVGENSFFPASAVLAMFPMLMGSQTPNFFPQQWWGVWHLSETLSYVGLSTLVLAGAAVVQLNRRTKTPTVLPSAPGVDADGNLPAHRGLARLWTWLGVGAFVWMLGYYLPTYRLIYMLPVLGVVRCPGRMLLVLDMALAVLAALTVDSVIRGQPGQAATERLTRAVRRGVTLVLPALMIATPILVALAAWVVSHWRGMIPLPFAGGAKDALASLRADNPALWVPLAATVATLWVVGLWLRRPVKAAPLLIALLLADLFIITRFVDVPGDLARGPDPQVSPAAAWLHANAPPGRPIRVYCITRDYRDRPAELLSPKTAQGLGIGTLGSYGAWHYPPHAHAFGFDTYGRCRDWRWLIRRNGLLSGYGVGYILAADPNARRLIESVRIAESPARPGGPNLLRDNWELGNAESSGGSLRLKTPFLWWWSQARQAVTIRAGATYRIALDARGPRDGAANFLRAEVLLPTSVDNPIPADDIGLVIDAERIGADWRHFEWTFTLPPDAPERAAFRIFTMSERAIEVRNVRLAESAWEQPININNRLEPGQQVYRQAAEVPAIDPNDPPVAIYENILSLSPNRLACDTATMEERIERLRWPLDDADFSRQIGQGVPDLALSPKTNPQRLARLVSLPTAAVYVILAIGIGIRAVRRRQKNHPVPPPVCNE